LPQGNLPAGGRGHDAAPAGWTLARLQQHRGPEPARALGDLGDVGDEALQVVKEAIIGRTSAVEPY
jgi:hypothetical protein